MDYTLSALRNRVVSDKLDDPTYDSSVVDRFINDAQRAIANTYELPSFEKRFSGVLPIGENSFAFPEDYQLEQALILTDPNGNTRDITKQYLPFREFIASFPSAIGREASAPSVWTLHGGKLYLSQNTDETYTLELWYLKEPTILSDDTDVPELPRSFEEVLVLGAFYRVLQRNEDFDLAAAVKTEYYEELDKIVPRIGRRQTGTPTVMRQPLRRGSIRRI